LGIAFELEEESEKIGVTDKKEMKMMMNSLTHLKKSMNAFKVLENQKEAKLNGTTKYSQLARCYTCSGTVLGSSSTIAIFFGKLIVIFL